MNRDLCPTTICLLLATCCPYFRSWKRNPCKEMSCQQLALIHLDDTWFESRLVRFAFEIMISSQMVLLLGNEVVARLYQKSVLFVGGIYQC